MRKGLVWLVAATERVEFGMQTTETEIWMNIAILYLTNYKHGD
jgi:hypothetical protein